MLIIKNSSIKFAWREAILSLFYSKDIPNKEIFKDEVAIIQIEKIPETNESKFSENCVQDEYYDDLFPMPKEEINAINEYIISGKQENGFNHIWTKLYRKRLFEEVNQIENVIDYLKKDPSGKRAQVTVWKNSQDINAEIAPCLQLLWFQIVNNSLIMHVHMRASDCFGKLLMNINEFYEIQKYVAKRMSVNIGDYYLMIDSCHFYLKDKLRIEEVVSKISSKS